jgi:hypothetical protein
MASLYIISLPTLIVGEISVSMSNTKTIHTGGKLVAEAMGIITYFIFRIISPYPTSIRPEYQAGLTGGTASTLGECRMGYGCDVFVRLKEDNRRA